jgi:hypothetical protein
MTDTELTKLYYKKIQLFDFLYAKCREDHDLLAMIVDEYIVSLSDSKLIELEDFLTNNFGDN